MSPTPTPFVPPLTHGRSHRSDLVDAEGMCIASTGTDEQAVYFLKAVNNHAALVEALTDLAAWATDPDDSTQFDRIADEFFRETGFMRPGKDVAAAMIQDREEAWAAWETWRTNRARLLLANARAVLESSR